MEQFFSLSVVIPVYCSGNILDGLVAEIDREMQKNAISYELILVDDYSGDNTWTVIENLRLKYSSVRGIHLKKNVGQFKATMIGISHSEGAFIVNMDDDMEHPPSEIIKLLKAINEKKDCMIIFGMSKDKYKIKGNWRVPKLRNKIVDFLWGKYPTDSFRLFRRELVFKDNVFLPDTIMLEVYLKHHLSKRFVGYTEVNVNPRLIGESNYNGLKKIKLFWSMAPYFWFKRKRDYP